MMNLEGKNALITGASGAIGKEIAKFLHERGAVVTLSGTRVERLEAVAKELGSRTHILSCNLSDAQETSELIAKAEELMGSVDILINNAGLTRDNLMLRMKDEDWEQVMNVNLSSAFKLSRAALRGMMKRRWGRIINITSIVGVTGNPGQTNYAASKAGMIGMAKSLASEVASRGVTVNCIAPGFIESAMTEVLPDDQKDILLKQIPTGRMGKPDEIASTVGFLASQEAGYITGQTIHVNGGMAMI